MRKLSIFSGSVLLISILACGGDDEAEGDDAPPPAPELAGDAVIPAPEAQPFAGGTLTATTCDLGGQRFTGESSMSRLKSIAAAGDHVYVADGEGVVYRFSRGDGGCTLELDSSFGDGGSMTFERKIEWLSAAGDRVFASNGISSTYVLDGGKLAYTCEATGYGEIDASGSWAIVPWVNSTVELAELGATSCTKSEWALKNLSSDDKREGVFDSVNASVVVDGKIYIGGSIAKKVDPDNTRTIAVFNRSGKELRRFGGGGDISSDTRFGWIHALNPCAPGICALDGNFRRLTAWSDDGSLAAAVDLKKLLGLKYPWINDFAVGDDGSAWFIAANDRTEGKLADGFIFMVDGLAKAGARRGSAAPAHAEAPADAAPSGSPKQRFGLPGKKGKGKRTR